MFAAVLMSMIGFLAVDGCAVATPACKVVEIANDACVLFSYTDENGVKRQEKLSVSDVRYLAAVHRAASASVSASATPVFSAPTVTVSAASPSASVAPVLSASATVSAPPAASSSAPKTTKKGH